MNRHTLVLLILLLLVGVSSVDAAVTVRAGRSEVVGSGTSPTLAEPASCASGDVEVALALSDTAGAISQPAGWTSKYSSTQGAVTWVVSIISRSGSAPNLTWGLTGTAYREVYIICLTGAATVTLDSQSAAGGTGNGASHPPDPPSTTAVASTSLAIAGGVNFGGSLSPGWTVSTGYTAQTDNATGDDGFMESKSLAASGSENPSALANVVTGAQDWWDGFTMTFTDASTSAPPIRTLTGVGKQPQAQENK